MFLLDSNVCIYHLNGKFPAIKSNISRHPPSDIGIPAIVKAELYFGAYKSNKRDATLKVLDGFLAPLRILPFGDEESVWYAKIRSEMEMEGKPIGANDLLIASIALAQRATLITHNVREFSRIRGLLLEDWTA